MFRVTVILFISLFIARETSAYRILGVFPMNGRSHEMMFEALMIGLAQRGHQVDVVTHFPVKNPPKNYKNIINLSGTLDNLINNFTIDFVLGMADDVGYHVATNLGNKLCNLLGHQKFQQLFENPPNDPPYDLLITEAFGANCYMGIGNHFKIPVIAASSAVEYPWVSDFTGNNDNTAVVPNTLFMAFGELSFWQRLKNTIIYNNEVRKFHLLTDESQTRSMRKYINPDLPTIREVERSVALTLVNSHFIQNGVKPVLPTVVQVGGLHIGIKNSTFSPDLKKWMDESTEGVVYFTLGSMVLIETLPTTTLKSMYASFGKLSPIRVLMKIADTNKLPPGLPGNVMTMSWIPQEPVLAHKHTKAFITHGGLMGSQEALYYGIPTIGIPLFADQPRNIESFVAKNISIKLPLDKITEKTLDQALNSILYDPKYSNSAKYHSKLFRDRPISAMDTAIYWVEYVIRNGPDVLRPPSLKLAWWQLALFDVYGAIILVFALTNITIFYMVKFILGKLLIILKPDYSINEKKDQ